MNYPAASCGVSERRDENFPKGVTPECFYRGSTSLTTTLSSLSKGSGVQMRFRLDSRLKHAGMTDFGKEISLTQQAAGN